MSDLVQPQGIYGLSETPLLPTGEAAVVQPQVIQGLTETEGEDTTPRGIWG